MVVDVGVEPVPVDPAAPVDPALPCDVPVVDVVGVVDGALSELGGVTAPLFGMDDPLTPVAAGACAFDAGRADGSSAEARVTRLVLASMVALTTRIFWNRIDVLLEVVARLVHPME